MKEGRFWRAKRSRSLDLLKRHRGRPSLQLRILLTRRAASMRMPNIRRTAAIASSLNLPHRARDIALRRHTGYKHGAQSVRFWYVLFRVITSTFFAGAITVAV